jgi:signal transduction histidine kinase/DNA-binding NarL/FixJ family response regulator
MAESTASTTPSIGQQHRWNIRQLQEQALETLYLLTEFAGLVVTFLTYAAREQWQGGVLGLMLMLFPFAAHALSRGRYLARAWLLVGLWFAVTGATSAWLPGTSAPVLLALPMALALLLISSAAGLLIGALASPLMMLPALVSGNGAPATDGLLSLILLWGLLALIWLALRPIYGSLGWSWEQYSQIRQQLAQARDTQADLKQALKDVDEAGAQMIRLNELLGAARRAAEEAQRAKTEFVTNVSHELRTPLNMIIGFAEMMLQAPGTYGRLPRMLRADLAVILRNSQHLSELIDDVLDLSQIEARQMALTREPTQLSEIVTAAAEAIRPLFQMKGLYLTTEVPDDLTLFCDRTRLHEVLLNLLSNAGRFTEQGGVCVKAQVADHAVTVSVADTGPGIAPEDQSRLFQPFQQVDGSIRRRFGGSGLGLAISKHFVEMHGGNMWMDSTPGKGTIIYFQLPIDAPASPATAALRWLNPEWEYRQRTRPALAPVPKIKPRVVVVEQGTVLQRLLRRYWGETEIAHAKTLGEAANELAHRPARALLVNDLSVGATVEHIRQANVLPSGTPALVCALPGEAQAAQRLGVEGYLVKPISRAALLEALDQLGITEGTVLLVDDEQDAIQLFWRMLASSGRGYRVLTANTGERALSILRSERPDVILLDLVMPGTDGFHLLALREQEKAWRDIPVIVMSARDPSGHAIAVSSVGIVHGGGLTVPQLLAYIQMVTGPLTSNGLPERPELLTAFPD